MKKNRSILINCLNEYYKIFKFNLIFQQQQQEREESCQLIIEINQLMKY